MLLMKGHSCVLRRPHYQRPLICRSFRTDTVSIPAVCVNFICSCSAFVVFSTFPFPAVYSPSRQPSWKRPQTSRASQLSPTPPPSLSHTHTHTRTHAHTCVPTSGSRDTLVHSWPHKPGDAVTSKTAALDSAATSCFSHRLSH